MPKARVSGVVVSHMWDDESTQDYTITVQETETGLRIDLGDGSDLLHIYEDSWEIIREQIDGLLEQAKEGNV